MIAAALGAAATLAVPHLLAQDSAGGRPVFRVRVDMVVHSFTVVDGNGRYVNGLQPDEIRVLEAGIEQHIVTFSEGNQQPLEVLDDGEVRPMIADVPAPGAEAANGVRGPELRRDALVGTNVFVLFDTSNYMYRNFVYASDAIADFVRGLDRADSVAVYTFSRNLFRASELTQDRNEAIRGLRQAVAGSDSALYNALLLTLRDAADVPGRKVVIVFSNGPDNASMLAPDDVRTVAENEGIPIYVISTNEVNSDEISSSVFRRITDRTGGEAFFARTWQRQVEAFESIRESLGNSYTVTYYPQGNDNDGFRAVTVEILRDDGRNYQVRGRPGYRPRAGF